MFSVVLAVQIVAQMNTKHGNAQRLQTLQLALFVHLVDVCYFFWQKLIFRRWSSYKGLS